MARSPISIQDVNVRRSAQQLRELADLVEKDGMIGFTVALIDSKKRYHFARGGYAEHARPYATEAALLSVLQILAEPRD